MDFASSGRLPKEKFPWPGSNVGGRDVGLQGQRTVVEALAHKNARRLSFLRCRWFSRPRVHRCDVVGQDQTEENAYTTVSTSHAQARPRPQSDDLRQAIVARTYLIHPDNYNTVSVAQLCADDEETPRGIPFHPGAERFYRQKGYLK